MFHLWGQLFELMLDRAANISVRRWIDRMRNRPEHVEFPRALCDRPRHAVTLSVTADDCLTAEELQAMQRYGRGVLSWWLLYHEPRPAEFAAFDPGLPRGDRPFSRRVSLPEGRYTLGVARSSAARRINFEVTSEGSLQRYDITRTEAHADSPV